MVRRGASNRERGNNTPLHLRFRVGRSVRIGFIAASICVDRHFRFHPQRILVCFKLRFRFYGPQDRVLPLVVLVSSPGVRAVRSLAPN